MVRIKTLIGLNQTMLQGDSQTVFQVLEMLDKRTIDSVSLNAYQKESSDDYEVTAVCNMTRAWKARQGNNLKHLKLII